MRDQASASALFSVLLTCSVSSMAAAPTIFWASDPIGPDQAVLMVGDSLTNAVVTIRAISRRASSGREEGKQFLNGKRVDVLQGSPQSLKFIIPPELPVAVYEVRVATSEGTVTVLLNLPTIYWIQGNKGHLATPGGWVRVFGRSLSLDETSVGRLVSGDGRKPVALVSKNADLWSVAFQLPSDVPIGVAAIQLLDSRGEWVTAGSVDIRRPPSHRKRFNVVDLGAVGNGSADATSSIVHAMEIASKVGGEVFFPAGRYRVSGTLAVPPNVALVGEGRSVVTMFWSDMDTPPNALIQGSRDVEIRDMTLYASNYAHFIVLEGNESNAGNFVLSKLRITAVPYRGRLKIEEIDARFRAQQKLSTGGGDLIRIKGSNIEITDSDFYGAGRSLVIAGAKGAFIARNRFYNGRWGWYSISGPNGLIFEENLVSGADLMSTGGGINTLDGSTSAENVYFARNKFERLHGWDREAITSDGGYGYFYGTLANVVGANVTLGKKIEGRGNNGKSWVGAGLFVLGGKGMGQYARIVDDDLQGGRLVLDRKFAVAPDETSAVTVVPLQQNFIFFRNSFEDAGVALQYYGTSLNHIAVENTSTRTAGIYSSGRWYRHYQPSWYCQFIGNRILEGNYYRGGANNDSEIGVSVIGSFGFQRRPNKAPLSLGAVHRQNEITDQGEFRFEGRDALYPGMRDVVVEVSNIDRYRDRIHVDEGVSGLLFRQGGKLMRDSARQ